MTTAAIPAEAFDHGDHRRYRRGCRCRQCRKAATARALHLRYLQQTGRGIRRSPDRAADRVQLLRERGLDDRTIKMLSKSHADVLYRIVRRQGTITAAVENRFLAIPVPPPSSTPTKARVYVAGLGTQRRLQALVAAGWHIAELARRLGKDRTNLGPMVHGAARRAVTMCVADEVRYLYAEIHRLKPEDHGVSATYAARARQYAAAMDWPGPGYWDDEDFDNPDFVPAVADKSGLKKVDVEHLLWCGVSNDEVKARTGASIAYVREVAAELRTGKPRDRSRQITSSTDMRKAA